MRVMKLQPAVRRPGIKQQRGMSLVATLLLLGLIVFGAYLVIRIVPLYIDDWAVQKILENIDQKEDIYVISKANIVASVARRFGMSGIHEIKPSKIMKIKAGTGKVRINVDYQREVLVAANIFIVVKFSHQYDFSK